MMVAIEAIAIPILESGAAVFTNCFATV